MHRAVAISLAIYAIIVYRRLSKCDNYVRTANAKPYGFNDELDNDTPYASYSSRTGLRNSADKRGSLGSDRLSIGSLPNPTIIQPVESRPRRYSHERDTQFDEYMVRKTSGGYKIDPASSSPPSDTPLGDSLTAISTVQSRSRGSSISQTMSYTSDHVLVSVPEEECEIIDAASDHRRDHEALLGHDSHK